MNHFSTSSLIPRCTNDITQVQLLVTMGLQIVVKAPNLGIWAVTKIAGKNLTWTAATGVAVVFLLVMLGVMMIIVIPKMTRMQKITDELNKVTREHLTGLRVIKAYNASEFHVENFEDTNKYLTDTSMFIFSVM